MVSTTSTEMLLPVLNWRRYYVRTSAQPSTPSSLGPETITASSLTRSSTTATFTATKAHQLKTGDVVQITGATQKEYNIKATVTVTSTTAFTFTVSSAAVTPATGSPVANFTAMAQRFILKASAANDANVVFGPQNSLDANHDDSLGADLSYLIKNPHGSKFNIAEWYVQHAMTPLSVSGITRTDDTATATTAAAHGLATGDKVYIAGADQAEYNGIHTITVTGASTFTYAVEDEPATPATGTITYTIEQVMRVLYV